MDSEDLTLDIVSSGKNNSTDNSAMVSNFTLDEGELPSDMRFNSAHVISIVGYSSLFVVSSIANLTVLWNLIKRYRKTKSRVNLLLSQLAVADLIVTFMMMPLEIAWAATVMWLAGDVLCRILSFFRIFGLFLSSNILICISIDRFYAIVCPLSTGKAAHTMKILLASAWIVSILSALPQVYIFHVEVHPRFTWYTQCVTFNSFPSEAWQTAYTVFGIVMIYLLPLLIIIVTYAAILITIVKKSKNSGAEGVNGEGLRRSGAGVLNRARARTLKMTIVIVLVFIFCWPPYYIIVLWFLCDNQSFQKLDERIQRSLFIFACVNSVMNPIVYGFFNLRKNKTRRNQPTVDHGDALTIVVGSAHRRTIVTNGSASARAYQKSSAERIRPLPTIQHQHQQIQNEEPLMQKPLQDSTVI